jgi:hypothetical protein
MLDRKKLAMAVHAVFALAVGCSGDSGDNGQHAGRGSPACNEWQSALCGWAVRCPVPGGGTCDQVKAIACKSDAEAKRCAEALSAASCSSPPSNCDVRDIADPAPAQKACNDFVSVSCDWTEKCQPGTRDACLQQAKEVLNCSLVIGVTLAYEQCMSEIPGLACTNTDGPPSCKGVLLK